MAQDQKKVLTKEWYQKLFEELTFLKSERLPSVLGRLKDAIWQWDISENSDYDAAMSEKDLIEVRIAEIQDTLENVEILEWSKVTWEVKYNSVVVLEDEKGRQETYRLVWTWEVDILDWTISFESPAWQVLKGKRAWDEVSIRSPRWRYKLKVLEVK